MRAVLMFREIDGEAVPYLWNDDRGENPQLGASSRVSSLDDFNLLKGEYGNRSRQITIVEGRAAAKALALIAQSDASGLSIITQLDNTAWSVGTVLRDGSYDSGLPTITDARERGAPLFIDADEELVAELDLEVLIAHHEPSAELIEPAPEHDALTF